MSETNETATHRGLLQNLSISLGLLHMALERLDALFPQLQQHLLVGHVWNVFGDREPGAEPLDEIFDIDAFERALAYGPEDPPSPKDER